MVYKALILITEYSESRSITILFHLPIPAYSFALCRSGFHDAFHIWNRSYSLYFWIHSEITSVWSVFSAMINFITKSCTPRIKNIMYFIKQLRSLHPLLISKQCRPLFIIQIKCFIQFPEVSSGNGVDVTRKICVFEMTWHRVEL